MALDDWKFDDILTRYLAGEPLDDVLATDPSILSSWPRNGFR